MNSYDYCHECGYWITDENTHCPCCGTYIEDTEDDDDWVDEAYALIYSKPEIQEDWQDDIPF